MVTGYENKPTEVLVELRTNCINGVWEWATTTHEQRVAKHGKTRADNAKNAVHIWIALVEGFDAELHRRQVQIETPFWV